MTPLLTPSLSRFASWLAASLLGVSVLTACGGAGISAAGPGLEGVIVFPPVAGKATFTAQVDGRTEAVVSADVEADGRYRLNLPSVPPLPGSSNVDSLPILPPTLPDTVKDVSCTGDVVPSVPAARVIVLNSGRFVDTGGAVTGVLTPATSAISNRVTALDILITTRTQAYADRDVRVTGDLNCTFTRTAGGTLSGAVQVRYDLKRGWNTIEIRTGQPDVNAPIFTVTSSQTLTGMNWRYLPITP